MAPACGPAPEGHDRWAVRLPADKPIELEAVGAVDPATAYRLRTNEIEPWLKQPWVPPPRANAGFVAAGRTRRRSKLSCRTPSGRWPAQTRAASS